MTFHQEHVQITIFAITEITGKITENFAENYGKLW